MGVERPELSKHQMEFILKNPLFFVATAPSNPEGHVNCSPKPVDWSFFVESSSQVGWFDLVGSGVETIAHLKENGRIVLMFCSFGPKPSILRLHGSGTVHEPGDEYFEVKSSSLADRLGIRAVLKVSIERVSTSCGYGVPVMEFVSQRSTIAEWIRRKGEVGLKEYKRKNNLSSVDGLPGLDTGKLG